MVSSQQKNKQNNKTKHGVVRQSYMEQISTDIIKLQIGKTEIIRRKLMKYNFNILPWKIKNI